MAKDVAGVAKQVKKQLGLDSEARKALDDALTLLEDVVLAFLGGTKKPSEATRRRLHDLLQNVVADDDALAALTRGVLTEEPEPAGFGAYAGASLTPRKAPATSKTRAGEAAEKKRQERERARSGQRSPQPRSVSKRPSTRRRRQSASGHSRRASSRQRGSGCKGSSEGPPGRVHD